jgi:hypothetical protein
VSAAYDGAVSGPVILGGVPEALVGDLLAVFRAAARDGEACDESIARIQSLGEILPHCYVHAA